MEFPDKFKREFYANKTKSQQAIERYTILLDSARELEDRRAESLVLLYLSVAYTAQQDYKNAFMFGKEGAIISKEMQLRQQLGVCMGQLGAIFSFMNKWEQSLDILKKARDILQTYDDKENLFFVILKMGSCIRRLYIPDAISTVQRDLSLAKQLSIQNFKAIAMLDAGLYYVGEKRRQEAVLSFEEAYKISDHNTHQYLIALLRQGIVYMENNWAIKALDSLRKALKASVRVGNFYHEDAFLPNKAVTSENSFEYQLAHQHYTQTYESILQSLSKRGAHLRNQSEARIRKRIGF